MSNSKFNEWSAKFLIGKTLEASVATHLQSMPDVLRQEYVEAYPKFALVDMKDITTGYEELCQAVSFKGQKSTI
ncbi:MAG TPA: hypothetical protein VK487_02100 [Candidatus Bathyarchaeia archaeon]|nr:hypothetical protein [Candidatus Bathyarchaeia archaeon]